MTRPFALVVLALVLSLLVPIPAARAGADAELAAADADGDDARLFVAIAARCFERDRATVEDWQRQWFPDADDLAVALFLSRRCGVGGEHLAALRREGLGWFAVAHRCGVPLDAFFAPVRRDPPPPFAGLYARWREHRRDPGAPLVLDDAAVRDLVAASVVHEYYGVPIDVAMRWRAAVRDVGALLAAEYRNRHVRTATAGMGPGPLP